MATQHKWFYVEKNKYIDSILLVVQILSTEYIYIIYKLAILMYCHYFFAHYYILVWIPCYIN